MPATAADVARWMADTVTKDRVLYQWSAVVDIEKKFGGEFTYQNENGNPAISRAVLKAFRQLTENTVVWERGERCWRLEKPDTPGKRQVDY